MSRARPAAKPSALSVVRADTGEPLPNAFAHSEILATSRFLGWEGIAADEGRGRGSRSFLNVAFAGHCVIMNLSRRPLAFEQLTSRGYRNAVLPPSTMRIHPAGVPIHDRLRQTSHWLGVQVTREKVRGLLGRDLDLRRSATVVDSSLAAVLQAFLAEIRSEGRSGPMYAEGLAIALVSCLARRAGLVDPPGFFRREATVDRFKLVRQRIEDRLAEPITIAELAAVAQLSPAHFAREFKRRTGESPHQMVMRRRVERGREMLLRGSTILDAAMSCGFADQAHFSRRFRLRFGVTPSAFLRTAGPAR